MPATDSRTAVLNSVLAGLGMAALLVVFVVLYLPAGLMVPLGGLIVLWILWAGLAAVGVWWFQRRPLWVLALPVVAVVLWYAIVSAGGAFLGWRP